MDTKLFLEKYRVSSPESEAEESSGNSLSYQAQEVNSGRTVLVELVPVVSLKATSRARFEAEATAARNLHHVNIPELYDFGLEGDHLVYVTQHLEGTLAEEWVNTYGPMPIGPVLRIALQVISALHAARLHQIVHRSINPANLVLLPGQTAQGEWPVVKVLHFVGGPPMVSDTDGTVAAFDKALHYVSPEQIQTGKADFRSEIYSLGCTMWFLLTGVPPSVSSWEKKGNALPVPADEGAAIPRKVRRLLAQMMSPDPEARARDPLEFKRKLQACLDQVDGGGAVSSRWGFSTFQRRQAGVPGSGRMRTGTFALAALFLIIATLSALFVPDYLRHRRNLLAGRPIGKLIGVPEAIPSVTPVPENIVTALASNSTQTRTAVDQPQPMGVTTSVPDAVPSVPPVPETATALASNSTETTPAVGETEPTGVLAAVPEARPSATADSENVAVALASNSTQTTAAATNGERSSPTEINESQITDAPSPATDLAKNSDTNQVASLSTPVPNAEPVADAQQPAADAPDRTVQKEASQTALASRAKPSRGPAQSSDAVALRRARKTPALHEVRRAEPAELEVRRAEPAPPAEGLDTVSLPRRDLGRSSRRGWVRGRFVGVTPDGRWMVALPSNEIIIVPPQR